MDFRGSRPFRAILRRCLRLLLPVAQATAQAVYVGVIEPGVGCNAIDEKPDSMSVRVLFRKAGSEWKTVIPGKVDPSMTAWVATFDGRQLGRIAVKNRQVEAIEHEDFARRDMRFPFVQIDKFAFPRNLGKRFPGWCGVSHLRPVVLATSPHGKDPDGWTPFVPTPEYRAKIQAKHRNALRMVCGEDFVLRLSMIEMLSGYRSLSGSELVSAWAKTGSCGNNPPWTLDHRWFLLDKSGVREVADSPEVVDAGDYDGDGVSELLFWYSDHQREGYVLLYDGFRKRAEYLWSYH